MTTTCRERQHTVTGTSVPFICGKLEGQKKMDIAKEIKLLRNKILVHSCIYYCMDDSIVNDHEWQRWADSLAKLQDKYPADNASVDYYAEAFEDWTGSTGHDLPLLNPDIVAEAKALMLEHGKTVVEPHLPI